MFLSVLRKIFLRKLKRENKLFCIYCGKSLKFNENAKSGKIKENDATIDHFQAICNGGLKYAMSNFVCSCPACNTEKGEKHAYKISDDKAFFKFRS